MGFKTRKTVLPDIVCFFVMLFVFTAFGGGSQKETQVSKISTGYDLIKAMKAKYNGKWYAAAAIEQKMTYYDAAGKVTKVQMSSELLQLPGKVRSTIGSPDSNNYEIHIDNTFYIYRKGILQRKIRLIHNVLVLGFDVYVQDTEKTAAQLKEAGFNLDILRESVWKGRPVYVVGAKEGDIYSNQFWIDKEQLYCVRILTKSGNVDLIEIECSSYKPLGGGWIAAELIFKRNGKTYLTEEYVNFSIPDKIDPKAFQIKE